MQRVVIFASGSGTNAERIIEYFEKDKQVEIMAIFSNNPKAGVLKRAEKYAVPSLVFDKAAFYKSCVVEKCLHSLKPDLIVLAGFLWKFPEKIITAYPEKIINIHPSLLPKYGGKGMYGMKVHQSVIDSRETQSGITIHFVNEQYDKGRIISQEKVDLTEGETPESLAEKIHQLEYKYLPKEIENLLKNS